MQALYITSIEHFSGKTAICLALGRRLKREGYKVGYFKPLSTQPWEPMPGTASDEDAAFIKRMLELDDALEDIVGVVLTPKLAREMRCGCAERDLLSEVTATYERVVEGKDIVLIEGSGSLREGASLRLGPTMVTEALDIPALAIVRYRNRVSQGDDCVAARLVLGERLLGAVINTVPTREYKLADQVCNPCLEKQGIRVLATLPFRDHLQAISVGEIADVLKGEFLVLPEKRDVLVEHLVVGAMSAEQALPRIRRISGSKAVITGGDRADIQLVALETATQCLILTGHLRPVPEVLRRAEDVGVPVLLVREDTMQTVEVVENVFGKTRLGQAAKLEQFEALLEEHFDFARLYRVLGLEG
ncbi:MAG TPA: phosphotransacetylase family protein [Chloroflexi bacterium]|nr:phosphotransacetylase family protein [Chloroflexota bacterium]